jgi:hypothetical protein
MFARESLIQTDQCTMCPTTEGLTYVTLWPQWLKGNEYSLRAGNPLQSVVDQPKNYIPVCGEDFDFFEEARRASYFNTKDKVKRIPNSPVGIPEGDMFSLACTVLTLPLMHPDALTRVHREQMAETHGQFVDAVLRLPELQKELELSDKMVISCLKSGILVAENAPKLLQRNTTGQGNSRFGYLQNIAG